MKMMLRGTILALILACACLAEPTTASSVSLRGHLIQDADKPAIETPEHKRVLLEGDEPTMAVLRDARLKGRELEAVGHFENPDRFRVDGMHTRALFVHQGGKRLYVTYWCDVCYIRTYSPGQCWCCHKETDLDLRESDKP
jgi:hypothetical protein